MPPPSGGDANSPVDGCGRGYFNIKLSLRAYVSAFDAPEVAAEQRHLQSAA